jgi:hypothetical protein
MRLASLVIQSLICVALIALVFLARDIRNRMPMTASALEKLPVGERSARALGVNVLDSTVVYVNPIGTMDVEVQGDVSVGPSRTADPFKVEITEASQPVTVQVKAR